MLTMIAKDDVRRTKQASSLLTATSTVYRGHRKAFILMLYQVEQPTQHDAAELGKSERADGRSG
jgi:hypothetical protein